MTAATALLQVLLVEDDLADVALMESSFAEHHAPTELHHVVDGADALAFLRHEGTYADAPRPDLILLDLNMPRVDGRQALSMIKTDEQLKAIPVVVFTTSATPADIVSSYGAHANAYITKPIDLDEYDRVVAQISNFYGRTVTLPRRACDATGHDGSTGDPTNSTPPA
ncbi:MAG TPA: response regulator [Actinoplanes sp.]|jgi:CheY-like chemotaxis protein